ncbi:MAG: AAA family ATPase [Bacteroidota bacterium]
MWTFPHYMIGEALDWDLLARRFDWISDMQGVAQDPIWHSEGDVFVHTQMVLDALTGLPEFQNLSDQDKHILVTAALLHDVEKRSTTMTEVIDGQERIVSPRHAKRGEFTARVLSYTEWDTPFYHREQMAKLVRLHGLPLWAIEKEDPAKEVIYASLVVNTEHLALLAKADVLGRICADQEELLLKIALFKELCLENQCWGKARTFPSDYARFWYFNKTGTSPDYLPFDDLKFEVTLLCALPGSGKDTYIRQSLDLPVLSLDDIRRAHKIDPKDKKKNGRVIQMAKENAKVWMRKGQSFVFNATNITRDMRSRWIDLFVSYGGRVKIIYIEVPYQQLHQQNRNRPHPVPSAVINRMIHKLEIPSYREAHEVDYLIQEE